MALGARESCFLHQTPSCPCGISSGTAQDTVCSVHAAHLSGMHNPTGAPPKISTTVRSPWHSIRNSTVPQPAPAINQFVLLLVKCSYQVWLARCTVTLSGRPASMKYLEKYGKRSGSTCKESSSGLGPRASSPPGVHLGEHFSDLLMLLFRISPRKYRVSNGSHRHEDTADYRLPPPRKKGRHLEKKKKYSPSARGSGRGAYHEWHS